MAGGTAVLAFFAAMVDWYAAWKGKHKWRAISKPLPILLLLVTMWLVRPGLPFPITIFAFGVLFGLLGDILLLFKGNVFFISGLLAFLCGHLCYIIGFNIEQVNSSIWSLLLLLPIVVLLGLFSLRVVHHVEKKMRIAIYGYAVVIVSMLYSTLLTPLRDEWKLTAVILAIAGGIFFVTSDTMLAFDRFLDHKNGVWVMITYHLAQMAITAAALIQYS